MADLDGLGQRVRQARIAAGLRQGDVARRTGLSRPSITNIEANRQSNLPVATLVRLADALGVSASALLGEAEMPAPPGHALVLRALAQRKRGWHLAWSCRRPDCDTAGDLTTPRREDAVAIFSLVDDAHRGRDRARDRGPDAGDPRADHEPGARRTRTSQ
jgi:transcriptional regulator with XRE-family HTH domain